MDPTPHLHSEIQERLGVLPNFFRLAPDAPDIAENLWGFAKFGYLDNPLPSLFKERLFVSLSRFCTVRYCIARHVGFLIGLGRPAGDARVEPEMAEQVVALLRRPLLTDDELEPSIARLSASAGLVPGASGQGALEPGSPLEAAVFDCAAHVFLQTRQAVQCREALAGCFDPASFQYLLVFLTFVRTAHFWTLVHPELEVERDISELLSIHEALAECVLAGPGDSPNEVLRSLVNEREALRNERELRLELEGVNADLREEREQLRVTLASIGDGVITTDTDGKILDLNAVGEQLTGWKKSEAVGLPLGQVFRVVHESSREPIDDPTEVVLRKGSTLSMPPNTLLIVKDGTEVPIDDSAAPIRDAEGKIVGSVLTFRDVSERRERQRVSELLAAVVESSEDAIISKGLDGIIQSWNAGAERIFGYTAKEAIGRPITMLIPPELASEEASIIARIKSGERIANFDTVRLYRDGRRIEVSETISPVKDAQGRVVGASKVVHDIAERREFEETLARAAHELAEADRRKDQFLAILAHELRNPLSPIRSCLEVLKAGASPDVQEPLSIMDRQVTQMVRLIDDLLDIARISRGQLELRKSRVNLQDVIDQALESVQPLVEERGLSVAVEVPEAPCELHADGARLTQVFANLLTNAAKYSPAGRGITLRAVAGERILVSVIDQGVGIAADKLDVIFGMFSQIKDSAHETRGLGIGLTMAKELAELHDGELTVHSDGPGKGATFTVTLPRTPDSAPPPSPPPEERDAPSTKPGLKVLVVDDSSDSAIALSHLLRLRGCAVQTAFEGPSALQAARDFLPAVVFLDIGMPGMSGLEVAERIRREPWGQRLTLVALSGWGQAEDREKSKAAGFDMHLVKPADMDAIDRILAEVAESHAAD